MIFYAVIDTNILVSALLKYNSIPGSILLEALDGRIIPILNKKIIEEYIDVLHRPKFHFNDNLVNTIIDEIIKRGLFFDEASIDEFFTDNKDIVFYAVTLEAQKEYDTYLVTGNLKHFPSKIFIISPKNMLDILNKNI